MIKSERCEALEWQSYVAEETEELGSGDDPMFYDRWARCRRRGGHKGDHRFRELRAVTVRLRLSPA